MHQKSFCNISLFFPHPSTFRYTCNLNRIYAEQVDFFQVLKVKDDGLEVVEGSKHIFFGNDNCRTTIFPKSVAFPVQVVV